jgi:hypothetical protein
MGLVFPFFLTDPGIILYYQYAAQAGISRRNWKNRENRETGKLVRLRSGKMIGDARLAGTTS